MAANLWHLALLLMAAAQLAAACSPAQRSACAKAPGNLTRIQIPQLVIVTWDDAVTSQSYGIAQSIMGGLRQRNGCGVPSTFFVTTEDTIPAAVQALYFSNNEIATHTRTHPRYPSAEEIVGARDWLANQTGIPRSKINGYRAPFLLSNAVARRALTEAGFLYDSSIPDTAPSSVSPNVRSRTWPYRMDAGIAQAPCQTGQCRASERYPLWEVPLWAVADARQQPIATMDPTGDAFAIYKRELEWRMSGNRAPLGLFFHTGKSRGTSRGCRHWLAGRPLPNICATRCTSLVGESLSMPAAYTAPIQTLPEALTPACLIACLPACLPAHLPAQHPTCQLAPRPSCPPACLPTNPPACRPAVQPGPRGPAATLHQACDLNQGRVVCDKPAAAGLDAEPGACQPGGGPAQVCQAHRHCGTCLQHLCQ